MAHEGHQKAGSQANSTHGPHSKGTPRLLFPALHPTAPWRGSATATRPAPSAPSADGSGTRCHLDRQEHNSFHFSRQNNKTKPRLSANSSPQQLPESLVKLSNNAMLLLSYGVPIAFLSGTRRHNVTVAAPCPAAAPPSPAWRACSASWQSPLWTKSHAALVCAGRTTDKAVWGAARAQEAHG